MLIAKNISKRFAESLVVDRVNLEVANGEILGIIGGNGAGKTTFFNCLSGYYTDYTGTVMFEGRDITHRKPHEICKRGIVRTFQIVKPFGKMTVLENAMVGAYNCTRNSTAAQEIAQETISFVGLSAQQNRPARDLTLSNQRRLELARALATRPKLLLLDEVMAGLTPTESEVMVKLIRKICDSGVTILMIEHVMSALMTLSNRVLVLDHGQAIALGTPEDISSHPAVIESYLGEI